MYIGAMTRISGPKKEVPEAPGALGPGSRLKMYQIFGT